MEIDFYFKINCRNHEHDVMLQVFIFLQGLLCYRHVDVVSRQPETPFLMKNYFKPIARVSTNFSQEL